jgi:hypothetical protein
MADLSLIITVLAQLGFMLLVLAKFISLITPLNGNKLDKPITILTYIVCGGFAISIILLSVGIEPSII